MNISEVLIKLRDDIKLWVENNILALKDELDAHIKSPHGGGEVSEKELNEFKEYVNDEISKLHPEEIVEPLFDDIPRIYLSGNVLPITKDETIMKFQYMSRTKTFDCYTTIKCQGTSSLDYEKKNFTIKLYEDEECTSKNKVRFKTWIPENKFVLKANFIDITHARNIVSANLWADCVKARSNYDELPQELKESPNHGAIDGFPVQLYFEGVYQGRYTLNIPKDPWMTNMDENNEQHCLLCAEDYASSCFRAPAVINETDWTDEIHKVVPDSILNRWNEVIDFVRTSSDEEFKSNLSNYFDIESLLDYYCFHYLICGLDAMGKNQVYITYDGNLWYATSYDMDSTWGLYWNGNNLVPAAYRMQLDYETVSAHNTSNLLYDRLESLFPQEIYDRYQVLRQGPLSIAKIVNKFENFMNLCPAEMVAEDFLIHPSIPGKEFNNLRQLRNFIVDRVYYTDDCIDELVAEEINANVLYQLPAATTFNGSNYVNTGVKLFDTPKDFTMILHGRINDFNPTNQPFIFHCISQTGTDRYPGFSLQYINSEEGYAFRGELAIYFKGQKIDTEIFKLAIVCKDGIVTTLKKLEGYGVESYRTVSGNYKPVNKNLILGARVGENNDYDAFWNGAIYDCVIYDQALSGGQINRILKNFPLRRAFNPNGQQFSDKLEIDWATQELYVTMNLNACTGTNENILSFGNNIGNWYGDTNIHMYYTASNDRLQAQFRINGQGTTIQLNVTGDLSIRFNLDGLYINDTLYSANDYPCDAIYDIFNLSVGSVEGANRSNATNYNISVRYITRRVR